jgi:hypothetical protein
MCKYLVPGTSFKDIIFLLMVGRRYHGAVNASFVLDLLVLVMSHVLPYQLGQRETWVGVFFCCGVLLLMSRQRKILIPCDVHLNIYTDRVFYYFFQSR